MPILDEHLLPLVTAVERVTGRRLHYSTLYRWIERGLQTPDGRRVRLEHVKAGSQRLTSEAAVRRLLTATTGGLALSAPVAQTNRQREAAVSRAEREAAALGI